MVYPIRDRVLIHHRLDPHETELHIIVELAELTPNTEIKGRLVGPRCAYRSTVEIAYPMCEASRGDRIEMRVNIPEPSWWEPRNPFLYQGTLELWQDGRLSVREQITHGIRDLQLTSKGLKLNGRSFVLRGKVVEPTITEKELEHLHKDGINALMTTFHAQSDWDNNVRFWYLADQYGFLAICGAHDEYDTWRFELLADMFVSAFACVEYWETEGESRARRPMDHQRGWNKPMFSVEWTGSAVFADAAFLLCRDSQLPSLSQIALPKLVLAEQLSAALPSRPDVIGWIELPTA